MARPTLDAGARRPVPTLVDQAAVLRSAFEMYRQRMRGAAPSDDAGSNLA